MAKPPVEEQSNKLANDKRAHFHKHLAIHILIQDKIKALQQRQKANYKAADAVGIPSKKIKTTYDLAKQAPSDIAKHYAQEFELLGYQGIDLPAQFNIFGGVDTLTPKKGVDFYGAGLIAALDGKDGNPPKNLKGPEQQRWTEGWQDGIAARVLGQNYLDEADAAINQANQPSPGPNGESDADPNQTTLEGAIAATEHVVTIKLSDFGPAAKLEDMEIDDLDLLPAEIEKATRIEVVDDAGRRNVLKSADGKVGIAGEDFVESSAEELAASTTAKPAADKED